MWFLFHNRYMIVVTWKGPAHGVLFLKLDWGICEEEKTQFNLGVF